MGNTSDNSISYHTADNSHLCIYIAIVVSECVLTDESSKKEGDLAVRFEIDPRLVLRYNKSARVLKIRNEKTKL